MKKLFPFFLLFLISCKKEISSDLPTIVSAAALNNTYSYQVDDYNTFNPCTGEYLHITGTVYLTETIKVKGTEVDYSYFTDYNGLTAIGLTTGDKYNGRGQVNSYSKGTLIDGVYTLQSAYFNNKLTFAIQGSGNDLYTTVIQHIKVNADGSVSVVNSNYTINSCK